MYGHCESRMLSGRGNLTTKDEIAFLLGESAKEDISLAMTIFIAGFGRIL